MRRGRSHLEFAAVILDEAAIGEEQLLPHDGGAQRGRARKHLCLQRCRARGRLCDGARVRPAAPDLWRGCPCLLYRKENNAQLYSSGNLVYILHKTS